MRSSLRQFSKWIAGVSLLLMCSGVLVSFQNCGGDMAAYNPLYDNVIQASCVGVSCAQDLSTASITSTSQGVIIDQKTASSAANVCDSTTCFDIGGYCDNGGFPGTMIYYKWLLAGQTPGSDIKSNVACDANGRWHLHLMVPFAQFDWTPGQIHMLHVSMHVLDNTGAEAINPTGTSEIDYTISIRSH